MTPYLACCFHHALEFALLVVFADQVADHVRSKTALRAQRQLFERNELRCRIDAPLQIVDRFKLRHLGADQAEYDDLAFWHVA